jgi:hypothetical protein
MQIASAFSREQKQEHQEANLAGVLGRRPLRRPTPAETERIARACPTDALTVPVIIDAIRRETGCSRATAYRAVSDAFAAGILERKEDAGREPGPAA